MKNCKKTCHLRWWQKMVQISLRSRRDSLICSSNSSRNRRLGNWICRIPPLWVVAETWVKSGEEWWRVEPTLHLVKRPVYRGLRGMGEEWRVFHDSIVYSNLEIKNPWCWSLFSISYCRFYYAVWTANWQIWRQLAVLGKTVNCSSSASLLFYVNSKLARPTYIINKEWWGKYGSDYFDRASFGYSYFISRKMS